MTGSTPAGAPLASDDRLAGWAMEVTDPAPQRDLGELAEWAAEVTDRRRDQARLA